MTFPNIDPNATGETVFGLRGSAPARRPYIPDPDLQALNAPPAPEALPEVNARYDGPPIPVSIPAVGHEPLDEEELVALDYRRAKALTRDLTVQLKTARETVDDLETRLEVAIGHETELRARLAEIWGWVVER